jgi:hypothetical protein
MNFETVPWAKIGGLDFIVGVCMWSVTLASRVGLFKTALAAGPILALNQLGPVVQRNFVTILALDYLGVKSTGLN